ncbi:MAG: hypothetical protein ACR2NA_12010 [Solirubrobacterales bacterium]
MSGPQRRPVPRYLADAPDEGQPHGRWARLLGEEVLKAWSRMPDLPEGAGEPGEGRWFPSRRWGGRVYQPFTAHESTSGAGDGEATTSPAEDPLEYYGHVSYVRPPEGEPRGLVARLDFTDVLAADNPDWQVDINDDVIGRWSALHGAADVTLIWGAPLVPGAVVATAEVDGETVDQADVTDSLFTLVAPDVVEVGGDELLCEVALYGAKGQELARESLYAPEDDGDREES